MVVLSTILSLLVIVLLVIDIRFTLHNKRMIRRQINRTNKDTEDICRDVDNALQVLNRINNEVELRKWCVAVATKSAGIYPKADEVIEAADKIRSYVTTSKEGTE